LRRGTQPGEDAGEAEKRSPAAPRDIATAERSPSGGLTMFVALADAAMMSLVGFIIHDF